MHKRKKKGRKIKTGERARNRDAFAGVAIGGSKAARINQSRDQKFSRSHDDQDQAWQDEISGDNSTSPVQMYKQDAWLYYQRKS